MSQIGSSSGVRVAAQPLSNIYTVLLLLGALALVLTLVMLCVFMDSAYGTILGVSEEGERAKKEPDVLKGQQPLIWAKLKEADENLKKFPEVVTAPAVGGGVTPPAEGDATTPPAEGATTPPAEGGATTPPAEGAPAPAPEGDTTPPASAPVAAPAAR